MPPPKSRHDLTPDAPSAVLREGGIESGFIGRLQGLKDEYPGGNGHTRKRLLFLQLFIVRNRDRVCLGKAEVGMQEGAPENSEHGAQASCLCEQARRLFPMQKRVFGSPQKEDESQEGRTRRASGQASTASCRVRRTDRPFRHHHQASKASGMKSGGEPSSFIIHPSNFPIAVRHRVKCMDDDNGNGFIWHTTGSGKTLTSFKASTLATLRDTLLPKLLSGELSVAEAKTSR